MNSSQNKTFLSIAKQFNFQTDKENYSLEDKSEGKDFYDIILDLMTLQEKIGKLQLVEKQVELKNRFAGLTKPSSFSWIVKELTEVSDNLSYIISNASKIQIKLANPAISNSLPLDAGLHNPVITITQLLSETQYSAER